jgi:23S rRNA (pseudouridine1915-N3)-methyltransferase
MQMGMKIKIRIVGRKNGSEKWLEDSYKMYETRLRPTPLEVETIWHKNDQDLIKGVQGDVNRNHAVVLLDPVGDRTTSEQFCENLYSWLDRGGSRVAFVIGGAEGLPAELLRQEHMERMSLSALTFTHQLARTLLVEQIYRASEIRKGSGYHK